MGDFINSPKMILLLIEMFRNGGIITYKKQDVYLHNASFKRAMKDMHRLKLVLMRQERTGNEYKLTNFGYNLGMMLNELEK